MTFAGFIYSTLQRIQAPIIRRWYDQMSRIDPEEQMTFMNYGWAGLEQAPLLRLAPEDEQNRYCIQLYDRVAGAVDLRGKRVLEIGCGRGGGAAFIKKYLKPSSMTGLDFARKGVEFCSRRFNDPELSFVHGDAQNLSFEDGEFDAVVNVESSHCYPCMKSFLEGVSRILKSGGHFLYTDYHSPEQLVRMRQLFEESGFSLLQEENISLNVLKALELDNDRKKALIRKHVPPVLRHMFNEFAGMQGTHTFNETLRTGVRIYSRFVLQKPLEVPSVDMGVLPSLQTADT